MNVVIFRNSDGSVGLLVPCDCGLTVEQIAQKDVPHNQPFLLVDAAQIPDAPQEAWEADFSNPNGIGMGPQRYFIAQAEAVLADADASDEEKAAAIALIAQMKAEVLAIEGVEL